MESLTRSFKAHSSSRHIRKISATGQEPNQEEQHILLVDIDDQISKSGSPTNRREVVVKVDNNNNDNGKQTNSRNNNSTDIQQVVEPGIRIWRESSYEFWKDESMVAENIDKHASGADADSFFFQNQPQGVDDPPLKLIEQFLDKQKQSGEMLLDMDLEMAELQNNRNSASFVDSPVNREASFRDHKVSFQEPCVEIAPDSIRRRYKESSDTEEQNQRQQYNHLADLSGGDGKGEVLKCTSNATFRRNSSLLPTRTKSRLLDPPEEHDRKSGRVAKSGQLKSGLMGKTGEEDDDDPFLQEDIPEEYKKVKIGAFTLIQWVSLILLVAALICSLSIPALEHKTVWRLHLWKWEVLILVLICGRLVSGWGIHLVVFFIERNFLLRKRLLYFVYGVRKAVQNCIWLVLVLITWHAMLDRNMEKDANGMIVPYITKILFSLLVTTFIWLVKTLLVKVLASSFHVSTYFDRIQDSLFNQYVIETLSGPPLIEIQHIQEENERIMAEVRNLQNAGAKVPPDLRAAALSSNKVERVIVNNDVIQRSLKVAKSFRLSGTLSKQPDDQGITIDHLHKLNQKNISAWNMKRLMNIIRYGVLSTLDERISDSTYNDEPSMQIRSEFEAKAAAKKIFNNVTRHGSKYIYPEDLMRFLREDEALKTISLFEGATENKRISKSALKNWVVNAFRERRALALTLNDTKTAVNKLHQMVNVIVGIIIVIIWLLILGITTSRLLVAISSQILVVVFIFGNTCKTVFESIIFLFAMHPYDVGDRCEVEGVQMIVEEMNILSTVFLRYDNQKIIYPNSVLSTKPISNFYRSPDMGEAIDFCVHVSTPVEKIAIIKQRIIEYIENKKDHWYPGPMVVVRDVEDMNRLKISVWFQHRMNHQDMGERWARRAFVVEEMIRIFRELDIEYRMLPLDVNVRNMPTLTSTRYPSNWTVCSN
ncbi:PREDICTED: mechanosensitive ion channel protein 6-like [Nelumbo nucifera]|uniref:Mechanosensitive ion channel protein n=2 Tax=Nelumbo nucifera TaxID=4432 RepID=A0A1U8AID5_NELNU|nr:PREDICTED: mechanosensitive ion channel protein 6-like [Nelumbo nucifera]DAD46670.1 TPA_asm: hypothetical protein HUJ06_016607 [Nelumbo nucifera]